MTSKIFDHLSYVKKRIFKGYALYVDLTQIPNDNKSTIQKIISAAAHDKSAITFALQNGDLILFFNNNKAPQLMDLLFRLKQNGPADAFTRYDLKKSLDALHDRIYAIQIFPKDAKLKILQDIPKTPLSFDAVDNILNILSPDAIWENCAQQPVGDKTLITFDLTRIRQKHFPHINLDTNPHLKEFLVQYISYNIPKKPNTTTHIYPAHVLNLDNSYARHPVFLNLSDVLLHIDDYVKKHAHLKPLKTIFILSIDIPTHGLDLARLPADFIFKDNALIPL